MYVLTSSTDISTLFLRLRHIWGCAHHTSTLQNVSTGHSGKHGHEFLEFEYSHGRLRYANNSNYRNDSLIRKESKYIQTLVPCLPPHSSVYILYANLLNHSSLRAPRN